jgi:hypothetical protein
MLVYLLNLSLYPKHLRISYTENEHEIRVTWSVTPFDFGSEIYYRETLCGVGNEISWIKLETSVKYYQHGDLSHQYQYVYTSLIQDTNPRCIYEYLVSNGIFSRETKFFYGRTPYYEEPFDIEDLNYQPRVILIGDMGVGNYSQYTRKMMNEEAQTGSYDFSIHLGDIAYDLDSYGGEIANRYMKDIESFASEFPYMTAPGNHEHSRNFTDYMNRFYMPRNWASQDSSFYYSFNFGRAHFIIFSTETIFFNSNEVQELQYKWLIEDLEQANKNRKEVPWIFTFAHKPFYCSIDYRYSKNEADRATNNNCLGQTEKTRNMFEDLFYRHKVDIMFSGHVHKYERNSAVYKSLPMPCEMDFPDYLHNCGAPVHVVTGNAGNDHLFEPISKTPQEWYRAGSDTTTGYGKLIVKNSTHVYWEQYDSETGRVVDRFWLSKNRTDSSSLF